MDGHLRAGASGLGQRTSWRQDVSQSGVIFDVGVHLLDLIQWVSGQPFVEVNAFTHPDRGRGEPDDTVTVLSRLDDDGHAVMRATREVATEHVVRVRDRAGLTEERFPASPAYELEVLAFESELRGERSLLPDGEDSIQTVAVTQAVLQAIDERRSVAVPAVAVSKVSNVAGSSDSACDSRGTTCSRTGNGERARR